MVITIFILFNAVEQYMGFPRPVRGWKFMAAGVVACGLFGNALVAGFQLFLRESMWSGGVGLRPDPLIVHRVDGVGIALFALLGNVRLEFRARQALFEAVKVVLANVGVFEKVLPEIGSGGG